MDHDEVHRLREQGRGWRENPTALNVPARTLRRQRGKTLSWIRQGALWSSWMGRNLEVFLQAGQIEGRTFSLQHAGQPGWPHRLIACQVMKA